jgi:hypothetical protein
MNSTLTPKINPIGISFGNGNKPSFLKNEREKLNMEIQAHTPLSEAQGNANFQTHTVIPSPRLANVTNKTTES